MVDKSFRSRVVGEFGGAGRTPICSPILQILLGLECTLWLFITFELLGALLIATARVLHLKQ